MSDSSSQCGCKVGRAVETYGLDDLDAELRRRRREREASLRELAAYTNRRILAAALDVVPADVFDGDSELFGALGRSEAVEAIYGALADDDVPPGRRARVRTRLEQTGIDVDEVTGDWVTHPTVRTHLRECLDIDTSSRRTVDLDDATNTIEWARSRCVAVVERTLDRLQSAGGIAVTEADVSVSIRITCTECRASYSPAELVSRGRCACDRGADAGEAETDGRGK